MYWVPLLAFEVLLLGLALYKGYECYKTYRMQNMEGGSGRLAILLVRDSVLYFTMWVLNLSKTFSHQLIPDYNKCISDFPYERTCMGDRWSGLSHFSIMIYLTRTSPIDRPTSSKFPLDSRSRWEASWANGCSFGWEKDTVITQEKIPALDHRGLEFTYRTH